MLTDAAKEDVLDHKRAEGEAEDTDLGEAERVDELAGKVDASGWPQRARMAVIKKEATD